MNNTDFLKLNVPALSDPADITKLSVNMEWIDAAIKTLNEIHLQISQRLTSLEIKADKADTNISEIRANLVSITGRIDDTIAKLKQLDSTTDHRITALDSKTTNTNVALSELRADISSLTRAFDGLISRVNANETETHANSTKITALSTQYLADMAGITKDVALISAKVDALENQYKGDIARLEISIKNYDATIKSITGVLENLDARVTALEHDEPQPVPPTPAEKFYVYWGASAATTATPSVISSLVFKTYTDTIKRTINVPSDNEYVYYAYPAGKGYVQFEVEGNTGGFGVPVDVPVSDSEGNIVNYTVYRSNQQLDNPEGLVGIKVK